VLCFILPAVGEKVQGEKGIEKSEEMRTEPKVCTTPLLQITFDFTIGDSLIKYCPFLSVTLSVVFAAVVNVWTPSNEGV